jgi:hypothetical protein
MCFDAAFPEFLIGFLLNKVSNSEWKILSLKAPKCAKLHIAFLKFWVVIFWGGGTAHPPTLNPGYAHGSHHSPSFLPFPALPLPPFLIPAPPPQQGSGGITPPKKIEILNAHA